jgi:hypothetical protein
MEINNQTKVKNSIKFEGSFKLPCLSSFSFLKPLVAQLHFELPILTIINWSVFFRLKVRLTVVPEKKLLVR